MSACTYQKLRLYFTIDDPMIGKTFETFQRHAFQNARSATLQQIIVKLATSNPVADRAAVLGFHFATPDAADVKSVDWLEDVAGRIVRVVNLQLFEHSRSYPSPTDFIAREFLFIED